PSMASSGANTRSQPRQRTCHSRNRTVPIVVSSRRNRDRRPLQAKSSVAPQREQANGAGRPWIGCEPPWVWWRLSSLDSNQDLREVGVDSAGVVPVDPPEGGQLDVLEGAPRAPVWTTDQLGLVQPVDAFRQGVVIAVRDTSDGGDRTELGQPFAVAHRGELAA